MKYQFIQTIDGHLNSSEVTEDNLEAWCAAREIVQTGINRNKAQRPELQGQPKFKGFLGPMYGGEGIIRYEDQSAYDQLSM